MSSGPYKYAFLLLILTFLSCNGLDNDLEFVPGTQASYFLVNSSQTGLPAIVEMGQEARVDDWHSRFGIGDQQLLDMRGDGTELWVSTRDASIIRIDLAEQQVKERYENLPLTPEYICPGNDYLLIADSSQGKLAFLRIRNGKITEVISPGHPALAIYNNTRFYLQIEPNRLAIYQEQALTPIDTITVIGTIFDLQIDKFRNVHVFSTDTAGVNYRARIEANGDFAAIPSTAVGWSQVQFTPYFSAQFQTEWLEDMTLTDHFLNRAAITDSVDHFELDFFESRLYYISGDSLSSWNLLTDSREDRQYFPFRTSHAFHYVDHAGE